VENQNTRALVAELIGTALLVLFIGLIVIVAGGGTLRVDLAVIGLGHVLILTVLVATLGGVSGGHFNPAVTITLAYLKKFRTADVGPYIMVQLIGATLGALIVKLLLDDPGKLTNYATPAVNKAALSGNFGGFVCEALGTFVLVGAVVGTAAIVRNQSALTPLLIGSALGFGVLATAPLTGAGLNPARSFGPALISGEWGGFGTFLFVYVLGPIVGGLLAGTVVNYLHEGAAEPGGEAHQHA
jgi:MIP family channel proteins